MVIGGPDPSAKVALAGPRMEDYEAGPGIRSSGEVGRRWQLFESPDDGRNGCDLLPSDLINLLGDRDMDKIDVQCDFESHVIDTLK